MYGVVKKSIKDEYYTDNYANDGERFLAWYLMNVYKLDKNQARECIVDGRNDKKIDAVYVNDEQQEIVIIQGKFYSKEKIDSSPLNEVLAAWVSVSDLLKLEKDANNKLCRKIDEISNALEDGYTIAIEFLTTSELTDDAERDFSRFQSKITSDNDDSNVTLSLVDKHEIKKRYDIALENESPSIAYQFELESGKFKDMEIAGTKAVIAAVQLRNCLSIPGIKDGTLFKKNVRQSLGIGNKVNKGMKQTIGNEDKYKDFFFFHNGVTAICSEMKLDGNVLKLKNLSVVNGCQSLNTIIACSGKVKSRDDMYILFRFYEIPQLDRADSIGICTNSQSAVKARDLRSNDKKILNLKKVYQQKYQSGYFLTKRGETAPPACERSKIVDVSNLGKYLMAWHSQRPNMAYSEATIFDKYFEQLFRSDYSPENVYALNRIMLQIMESWNEENPLGLNISLLALKAYAPQHHLYAVSQIFSKINQQGELVPNPSACLSCANSSGLLDNVIVLAGNCLNSAFVSASEEALPAGRVFSPQNWVKTKACLTAIKNAVTSNLGMLSLLPDGKQLKQRLEAELKIPAEEFSGRWSAD